MFTMMNEARLLVGMQGLADCVQPAYQNSPLPMRKTACRAVRSPGPRTRTGPADPLIVHPDVRRLLLDQKSFIEGGRGFLTWVAMLIDASKHHTGREAMRERADDVVGLLTPVVKGFLTEEGYRLTAKAQQVFGGHGYIEEWGMSQFVRDSPDCTMIYEGTRRAFRLWIWSGASCPTRPASRSWRSSTMSKAISRTTTMTCL